MEEFEISGKYTLTIDVRGGSGAVRVNTIIIDSFPWNGTYFKDVPIKVELIPDAEYDSVCVEGFTVNEDRLITLNPEDNTTLIVHFFKSARTGWLAY